MLYTKDFGELYFSFSYEFSEKENKISYSSVYSNNYEVDATNKEIIMYYDTTDIRMLEDKCFIPNVDEEYEGSGLGINRGFGVVKINDKYQFKIRKIDIFMYTRDDTFNTKVKVVYHYVKEINMNDERIR